MHEQLQTLPDAGTLAVVQDGSTTIVGLEPDRVIRAQGVEALAALDGLDEGWWAGFLAYDLGRAIERVPERAAADPPLPDLLLARFTKRCELIRGPEHRRGPDAGGWRTSLDRAAHAEAVGRIAHHLYEGDCYQVNLTRRLETDTPLDPVALYETLRLHHPAPHAALIRIDDVAVVSASPESFLRRDGAEIVTRPIKGTGTDADALVRSEKDRAENVMIVDLARNDLGRVCAYGSVTVPALCEPEEHPGLVHLVSTVRGTLRADVSVGDIIRATFPPASVTGCPKPRVLQIIESLEPVRRGVYCGAIGFIDTVRNVMDLNVAIRTFTITGGKTYFGVGGGIVADSDASAEWDETELKARRLIEIASGPQTSRNLLTATAEPRAPTTIPSSVNVRP
ncbi:MAG: anthranilate synthase component I family protein [Actinomycetota bacterium]